MAKANVENSDLRENLDNLSKLLAESEENWNVTKILSVCVI